MQCQNTEHSARLCVPYILYFVTILTYLNTNHLADILILIGVPCTAHKRGEPHAKQG
jgi:hypothetical protein